MVETTAHDVLEGMRQQRLVGGGNEFATLQCGGSVASVAEINDLFSRPRKKKIDNQSEPAASEVTE